MTAMRADKTGAFVAVNLIREHYVLPGQKRAKRIFFLGLFIPLLLFSLLTVLLVSSANRAIINRYERMIRQQQVRVADNRLRAVLPSPGEKAQLVRLQEALDARGKRTDVAARMSAIARLLPEGFHLEEVHFSGQALRLTGQGPPDTRALAALTRFTGQLNRDAAGPGAGQVKLGRAEERDGALSFTITAEQQP